jgi:2,3-bisphosphoglycerate-independent phosphoglycerate mutase
MIKPHVLFLFVDGIGLGEDSPTTNPFSVANLPTLHALTNGKRWLNTIGIQTTDRAYFVPTDPRLGVAGRPQSGSSQAAILTGLNVPQIIGEHYGPKPNEATRNLLKQDNFFMQVKRANKQACLIDAYPPSLIHNINRGKTLPSSIQLGAIASGQSLFDDVALRNGQAITAEWTGEEWRSHLKFTDTPVYTPQEAGKQIVKISRQYDFTFHSHWMTDYIGHRGTIEEGAMMLERLDGVIEGILSDWQDDEGLIIVTSDHGNMELVGDRHHTENDVPTLIIGKEAHTLGAQVKQLTDFVPMMAQLLDV